MNDPFRLIIPQEEDEHEYGFSLLETLQWLIFPIFILFYGIPNLVMTFPEDSMIQTPGLPILLFLFAVIIVVSILMLRELIQKIKITPQELVIYYLVRKNRSIPLNSIEYIQTYRIGGPRAKLKVDGKILSIQFGFYLDEKDEIIKTIIHRSHLKHAFGNKKYGAKYSINGL